jgi:hypothetical protein
VHQVPLPRLQSIVSGSSPNTSIAEVTDLLRGTTTERIACLVIEVTTPELAALRVRSEAPPEIQLGAPETPLESAKMAAAPIADTTARSSKKVAGAALSAVKKVRPHARRLSLTLVDIIRQSLATKNGRGIALALIVLVVVIMIGAGFLSLQHKRSDDLVRRYQSAYDEYLTAQKQYDNGDKTAAETTANSSKKTVDALKPSEHALDAGLAKSKTLKSGEPRSLGALETELNNLVNEISGLTVVKATTIASLSPSSGTSAHFEVYNGKAYIFDSQQGNQPSIVNLATGAVAKSKAGVNNIGNVKYTSLSSDNTGLYILTDKPGVWFYRFSTDTLTPISTAFGQWPSGSAIASYLNNLYVLSDDVVYKYPKTAVGFSPPVKSLSLSGSGSSATALAVDGSIYAGGSKQIQRYISGKLVTSADMPPGVGAPTTIRSTGNATRLIATSSGSGRIAIWTIGNNALTLVGQVEIQGADKVYDTTYNSQTDTYYATVDHRLVSFQLSQ